jgi:hypothetical protein
VLPGPGSNAWPAERRTPGTRFGKLYTFIWQRIGGINIRKIYLETANRFFEDTFKKSASLLEEGLAFN